MNTFYIIAALYFTIGIAVSILMYWKKGLTPWAGIVLPGLWPFALIALVILLLESATEEEEDESAKFLG